MTLSLGTTVDDVTTNYLTVENGQGALLISSAGIAGRFGADVTTGVSGFDLSAGVEIAINTTPAAVMQTVEVGGEEITLDLPAGPFLRLEANDVELTVAGQTLTGDFSFERTTNEDGQQVIRVGIADLSFALVAGGKEVVSLSNGTGNILLVTGGMAARISGTVALNVPGVTFGGTLTLELNTTTAVVNEVFKVGGADVLLALPAGPFVRFAADNVVLDVLGQTLSGDFSFEQSGGTTTITVSDASLSLGDGVAHRHGCERRPHDPRRRRRGHVLRRSRRRRPRRRVLGGAHRLARHAPRPEPARPRRIGPRRRLARDRRPVA